MDLSACPRPLYFSDCSRDNLRKHDRLTKFAGFDITRGHCKECLTRRDHRPVHSTESYVFGVCCNSRELQEDAYVTGPHVMLFGGLLLH